MIKTIQTVTILGANGTMGRNIAAIFASFGNAQVYMISRSLEKSCKAKESAYKSVRAESIKKRMIPADYENLEECIEKSDLIFEACAENWTLKQKIHQQIAAIIDNLTEDMALQKIVCSGTSGLSITKIAEVYGEKFRSHVIGMHFFNPPYQMTLCELTPTEYTDRKLFDDIQRYTERILFRTTVKVKDSPAFLGNRIGFHFINEAVQLADQYQDSGGIDYIDAIFGPFTGRTMPPIATANFVGLDVHKAIIDNLYENTCGFSHESFVLPLFVKRLIEEGKLGRKSGAGYYKTILYDNGIKSRQVYDIESGYYRDAMKYRFLFVEKMLELIQIGSYQEAFHILVQNHSVEAELCLEELLRYVLYALNSADEIGETIQDADDVIAAGFNWCPPLAMIEVFGGKNYFVDICKERISKTWMNHDRIQELISKTAKSKYDFRRFIRA